MCKKISLYFVFLSMLFSCAPTAEEKQVIQAQEDSIAKAEAEALDQEAAVAQRMIDSTIAVERADSIKQSENKKATP